MFNQRLVHIIRKEFRQTLREPRMRGMLLFPPLIQLFIFGTADTVTVIQLQFMNIRQFIR